MPEIAGAVLAIVERDFGEDHVAVGRLQDQADGIAVTAEQHEVDAIGHRGGTRGAARPRVVRSGVMAGADISGMRG